MTVLTRLSLPLVCYVLLTGCRTSYDAEYRPPVFADEASLKGEVLSDSLRLMTARDIALSKDHILVTGYDNEQWLHIFDRRNGQLLRNCIGRGKGPGEMLFAEGIEITPAKEVIIWDIETKERNRFSLDSLLSGNTNPLVQKAAPVFEDGFWLACMNYVAPGKWLFTGSTGWERHPIRRFRLGTPEDYVSYDLYPEDSTSEDFWGFWRSATSDPKVTVSPDGTKMAHGLLFGCVLETFDLSGDTIRPIAIRRFYKPDMIRDLGVRGTDDTHLGFTHLTATDRRIFGIYVDQVSSEADNSPNSIVVFDWEGNPLARYRTDYCLVALVAAPEKPDTDETEIFAVGVSPDDGEWKLLRFPIPV